MSLKKKMKKILTDAFNERNNEMITKIINWLNTDGNQSGDNINL